jgi:hypothetical protein
MRSHCVGVSVVEVEVQGPFSSSERWSGTKISARARKLERVHARSVGRPLVIGQELFLVAVGTFIGLELYILLALIEIANS